MRGDPGLPAPRLGTADLLSSLEDLELSNRRLAGENAKLQRSVETAEEGSARLGEEILALRKQLRRWARPRPPPCAPVSFCPKPSPALHSLSMSVTHKCPFFFPSVFYLVSQVLVSQHVFILPSQILHLSRLCCLPHVCPIPLF